MLDHYGSDSKTPSRNVKIVYAFGLTMVHFKGYLDPLSPHQLKQVARVGPPLTHFLDACMDDLHVPTIYLEDGLFDISLTNACLSPNNKANSIYMYKKEHIRDKIHLAFNYIPTPRSFNMKFGTYRICEQRRLRQVCAHGESR